VIAYPSRRRDFARATARLVPERAQISRIWLVGGLPESASRLAGVPRQLFTEIADSAAKCG
jgi:hypothetical protein